MDPIKPGAAVVHEPDRGAPVLGDGAAPRPPRATEGAGYGPLSLKWRVGSYTLP